MSPKMKEIAMHPVSDDEAIVSIEFVGTPSRYRGHLVIDRNDVTWLHDGVRSSGRSRPLREVIDWLKKESDLVQD